MPEAAVSQRGRTLLMVYPPPGEMAVRQEVKQIETGSCDGFGGPEKLFVFNKQLTSLEVEHLTISTSIFALLFVRCLQCYKGETLIYVGEGQTLNQAQRNHCHTTKARPFWVQVVEVSTVTTLSSTSWQKSGNWKTH